MKSIIFLMMLAVPFGNSVEVENLNDITKALGNGDVTSLSKYFDEMVEISIMDDEDSYDKDEAIDVITGFFSKHQPKSFTQMHNGSSKGKNSHYSIGNLATAGKSFRVYLYMKEVNGTYLIQELRFDYE